MSKEEDEVKPIIVGPGGVEQPAEAQTNHAEASGKKPAPYRMSIDMKDRTSPLLPERSDDDIIRRITPPGGRGGRS